MATYKIVKKAKHDFNKELDNVSSKIKEESEKNETSQTTPNVKMEIQPHDKVMFQGKKVEVLSSWPNGDIVLLVDGMTVECSKSQVTLVDKIDTMDVPMKFKNGLPIDESAKIARVTFKSNNPLSLLSEAWVNVNEYNRKSDRQKVRVLTENHGKLSVLKEEIELVDAPDGVSGDVPQGYVPAVIVGASGEAERKCFVKAVEYAECMTEDGLINVKFYSDNGFVDGTAPKSMLRTLSV